MDRVIVEVEAISSFAVCCVCVFVCASLRVEGHGWERQTPSHLSIRTRQSKRGGGADREDVMH